MWDMFGVVVCKSVRVSAHCKLLHPHGFEDRVPRKVPRNSMVNHHLPQNSHKLGDHRPFHCWLNCIPIPFPNFGVSCRCMSVHLQLVSKILALGRRLGRTLLLSIAVGRYANPPCPATRWLAGAPRKVARIARWRMGWHGMGQLATALRGTGIHWEKLQPFHKTYNGRYHGIWWCKCSSHTVGTLSTNWCFLAIKPGSLTCRLK